MAQILKTTSNNTLRNEIRHSLSLLVRRRTNVHVSTRNAVSTPADGDMLGVIHIHADPNYEKGEYAILVRSDIKGRGLGWQLMHTMIQYAQWLGLREIEGEVLNHNKIMLNMCDELGFAISSVPENPGVSRVRLRLERRSGADEHVLSNGPPSNPFAH